MESQVLVWIPRTHRLRPSRSPGRRPRPWSTARRATGCRTYAKSEVRAAGAEQRRAAGPGRLGPGGGKRRKLWRCGPRLCWPARTASRSPRPGAPRKITDEQVELVITKTLEEGGPDEDTHRSTQSMAVRRQACPSRRSRGSGGRSASSRTSWRPGSYRRTRSSSIKSAMLSASTWDPAICVSLSQLARQLMIRRFHLLVELGLE